MTRKPLILVGMIGSGVISSLAALNIQKKHSYPTNDSDGDEQLIRRVYYLDKKDYISNVEHSKNLHNTQKWIKKPEDTEAKENGGKQKIYSN